MNRGGHNDVSWVWAAGGGGVPGRGGEKRGPWASELEQEADRHVADSVAAEVDQPQCVVVLQRLRQPLPTPTEGQPVWQPPTGPGHLQPATGMGMARTGHVAPGGHTGCGGRTPAAAGRPATGRPAPPRAAAAARRQGLAWYPPGPD